MAPSIHVDHSVVKESGKRSRKQSDTMMAKSQKFSKGYSSGFVSDYRHAVDNIAESEGFGSSGRVEAEMTASEDSSAPKRKCISLNADSCDGFRIPVEVFSVSKMSRPERRQLELRLKSDLDRVQNIQRRIRNQYPNVVPVSSSSDIHSLSNGKKAPVVDSNHRLSGFLSKQGKKKVPISQNNNGLNRGLLGRFEGTKQEIPPSVPQSKFMEQCEALLKRVMAHDYGWVFNAPVDVVKLNIPDYFTVIKHPMDLGTVKSKLDHHEYSSPWEFLADVRLTFSNAMTYNPQTNDVHLMAKTVSKFFEQRWKNIQKKLPPTDLVPTAPKSSVSREPKAHKPKSPFKKRKISSIDHEVRMQPVKRVMSDKDKHILSMDLESLISDLPNHIVEFLRSHSFSEGQNAQNAGEDEIEVDIDVLNDDTLFKLRKLVDDYLQDRQRNCAKVEPMELDPQLNETVPHNSSTQPCKGNDPVDEDVDIGGNDLPVANYPPVEIEKDIAHRSSKCSSSSSSSSDSSSSSSDSDSGSSSGSDTEGAKAASSPVNRTKENLGPVASQPQTEKHGDSHNVNQSHSELDQPEQNPESNPASLEADNRQSEENAAPERQVSPDKLYRAALLRSRFADTILKAREKTLLDQGEKGDPEKLRREREELERKQREEKARLQAEAQVAEAARRQAEAEAEAEAAAEAKRKRELDREAARQALQMMEKTVEINENCHFLETLEMLGTAGGPTTRLPMEEATSPDGSPDGFKLHGNNPLEQLGLYMKMDYEEEEEEGSGPPSFPEPVNDVEEGEID